jgi:hypothetical protein
MEMDRQHGHGMTLGEETIALLTSQTLYKRLDYKTYNDRFVALSGGDKVVSSYFYRN